MYVFVRIQYVQYINKKYMEMSSQKGSKYHTAMQLSTINETVSNHSSTAQSTLNQHRKYGNLKILFENDRFLITLGPDYWCFTFAMVFFVVVDLLTITQIYKQGHHVLGVVTIVGAIIQVLCYIMIAISNPGIITQADFDTEEQQSHKSKRFCNICNLPMLPRSRHCSECDVCIKGYDHHCPWTSKCIGQHNLYSYTPLFLIYCLLALGLA